MGLPAGREMVRTCHRRLLSGQAAIPRHRRAGDVPVFVKDNTILPLAKPVQNVQEDTVFELIPHIYGDTPRPARSWQTTERAMP